VQLISISFMGYSTQT